MGRKHVATLMRKMGIEALYRKPNTSKKHPQHKVFPDLLRGLKIERANHVWAMGITLNLGDVANSFRHTRRKQHGHFVRPRACPRLTVAPFRDRTVAKAPQQAMSLH